MMHFDIKKLKDRVVKKVSKSFKKETRAYSAKSDDGVYDELPGSSKRSLKNNDENLHYDTPPPGVRPVNHPPPPPDLRPVPVREWKNTAEQEDPEREWYKTQDGPELWDTDDIMDIVLDELISESEQKVVILSHCPWINLLKIKHGLSTRGYSYNLMDYNHISNVVY